MSVQQDRYLELRAAGAPVLLAAADARIPVAEAELIERDIARGELIPAAGRAAQSGGGPIMAQRAKPGERTTNLSETKDIIRNVVPRIVQLKKKRADINADIAAEREKVNAAGISKHALDHAIKIKEMDPEDRQAFDEGVAIVRDAIHVGMSRSLFDMLDEDTAKPDGEKDEGGESGERPKDNADVVAAHYAKDGDEALEAAKKHLSGGKKATAPAPDAVQ